MGRALGCLFGQYDDHHVFVSTFAKLFRPADLLSAASNFRADDAERSQHVQAHLDLDEIKNAQHRNGVLFQSKLIRSIR
jgi:hypothetical protein